MIFSENYDEELKAIEELRRLEEKESGEPWQLTKMEVWMNYTDDLLYEMEKHVRRFLEKSKYGREYHGGQTIVVSQLFKYIFGRPCEAKDSKACRMLHKIVGYYASKRTGKTTWNGQVIPSGVYKMGPKAGTRQPMSIRLRIEERGKENIYYYNSALKGETNWPLPPRKVIMGQSYAKNKRREHRGKEFDTKRGYGERKKDWERDMYGPDPAYGPGENNDRRGDQIDGPKDSGGAPHEPKGESPKRKDGAGSRSPRGRGVRKHKDDKTPNKQD